MGNGFCDSALYHIHCNIIVIVSLWKMETTIIFYAINFFHEITDTLRYLYSHRMTHRLLQPYNIPVSTVLYQTHNTATLQTRQFHLMFSNNVNWHLGLLAICRCVCTVAKIIDQTTNPEVRSKGKSQKRRNAYGSSLRDCNRKLVFQTIASVCRQSWTVQFTAHLSLLTGSYDNQIW